MQYSLEELLERFAIHAQNFEEQCKKWREENPDVKTLGSDNFNLPMALHTICSEIKKLKDKHGPN